MGQIRLVVTDIDGTLLDSHGRITRRTAAALQAMDAAGVTLALATGRRWTGAALAAADLSALIDFRGPVIHFDGAVTRQYPSGETVSAALLDRGIAQRVAESLASYGVRPIVQYSGHSEEHLHVAQEAANPLWTADYLDDVRQQVRYRPLVELCEMAADPIRIVVFGPMGVLRRAAVDLASEEYGQQLLPIGNYGLAELTIFSRGVSKGSALVELARTLAIPIEETMAVGDGVNDVSMLRAAGLGVAMGQALRRVQRAANIVTAAHDDDGLARAIESYVLALDSVTDSGQYVDHANKTVATSNL